MSTTHSEPMYRRDFLGALGRASLAAVAAASLPVQRADGKERQVRRTWKPVSDRKIRVGIVGYGVCRFGAAFGFRVQGYMSSRAANVWKWPGCVAAAACLVAVGFGVANYLSQP